MRIFSVFLNGREYAVSFGGFRRKVLVCKFTMKHLLPNYEADAEWSNSVYPVILDVFALEYLKRAEFLKR